MSAYEVLFLLAAAGMLLLSLGASNFRGAIWIAMIAADAVVSDAYTSAGYPLADAFMATCDLCVIVAIYFFAAYRWELRLWSVMMLSMLVSILHLGASVIATDWIAQEDYLLVLELTNYAAIILIGGVSGFVLTDRKTGSAFQPWLRLWSFGGLARRAHKDRG